MVIQNRVYDAIIDHADESGYHAPEAVVKATSKTDDPGNDIVSQSYYLLY